jgi:hypothetical protein
MTMAVEIEDLYNTVDIFCESLVRIDRVGSCGRLVFAVRDCSDPYHPVKHIVAKLIVPGELMAEITDQPDPISAFPRLCNDVVAN